MQSLDNIMNKLYGASATQMLGGASNEVVEAPAEEYINIPDFDYFLKSFYLYRYVSTNNFRDTVYVIPSRDKLEAMVKELNEELTKNNIEPNTKEAMRYCVTNQLPYKRCIFDVIGDSKRDDYRLNALKEYFRNFNVIKRTNKLDEQFYFKKVDSRTVKICSKPDCNEGVNVTLIGFCKPSVFIFRGDIPKAEEHYNKSSSYKDSYKKPRRDTRRKSSKKSLTGGSLESTNELKQELLKNMLEESGEHGAYEYVSVYGIEEPTKTLKDFSGNLIHSAFNIAFDNNINTVPDIDSVSKSQLDKSYKALISKFKPTLNRINNSAVKRSLMKCYTDSYKSSNDPIEVSTKYVQSIKDQYKSRINNQDSTAMLKADIASNMYNEGYENDIATIFKICNAVDDVKNSDLSDVSKIEFEDSNRVSNRVSNEDGIREYYSSKLASVINTNLSMYPLVGLNAKSFMPINNYLSNDDEVLIPKSVEDTDSDSNSDDVTDLSNYI